MDIKLMHEDTVIADTVKNSVGIPYKIVVRYEAMAGVPTTEDLYLGFGATEVMVKDCKYRKQPL